MTLDGIFTEGYKKLVGELKDDQEKYLRVIAEAREMPVEWIEKAEGIFIPNNDFMYFLFGQEILQFDCYRNGQCIWDNALIFPVRGADDRVAGFAGFFPFKYVEHEAGEYYYSYSSTAVFQKGRFLYMPNSSITKAIEDEYLIVVDGLFDAISLSYFGYNVASFMGSTVTPERVMQLRFVKNVLVASDNDKAGMTLYGDLKKVLNNVEFLPHAKTKDIDELLKSSGAEEFRRDLNQRLITLGVRSHFGEK